MYNVIVNSGNYSKKSGNLWQCYRDEPFINDGVIIEVPDDSDRASFKSKQKIADQIGNNGTKLLKRN